MLNRRHFVFGLSAVPAAAWSSARMQACLFRRRRCIQFLRNCPCPPAAQATQYQPEVVLERQKPLPACIFIWLDGGPSTIDMWDLKSDAGTRGPFRPIPTAGGMEICEHLPKTAKVMDKLSIVRSMSTREASHSRASYYAHTGCVPNPTVDYPSVGAVIAQTLGPKRLDFKLPGFISINGPSVGAGFLGGEYTPLVIDSDGRIVREVLNVNHEELNRRLAMLNELEPGFATGRGRIFDEYQRVKQQAIRLMTSDQLGVFQTDREDPKLRVDYGDNDFGRGVLMARRLVEAGVPFVEVSLPGWDVRHDYFKVLQESLLPTLDSGLSTLVRDLESRRLLDVTVIVVAGAYGRSPRIERNGTRAHWANSWSLVMGGGGLKGGIVVGETNANGTNVTTEPFSFQDVWATVGAVLGVPLNTHFMARSGRPFRIFNGGRPIKELLPDSLAALANSNLQFNRGGLEHLPKGS